MKAKPSHWYKENWSLDIKKQSWSEDTRRQVDFIIQTLHLNGSEKILDLACGYGRHALRFAEKGYTVTGIDITKEYILDAKINAGKMSLANVSFIHEDIRNIEFSGEFDVVLNLADGAVGYLETEEENLKIFDVISKALKPGGKHFMDICNAEFAERHFPMRSWDAGECSLSLSAFEWDPETRIMLFGGAELPYGEPTKMPVIREGDPIRLYSPDELKIIMDQRGMKIEKTFSDFSGKPAGYNELQLIVYSTKCTPPAACYQDIGNASAFHHNLNSNG